MSKTENLESQGTDLEAGESLLAKLALDAELADYQRALSRKLFVSCGL